MFAVELCILSSVRKSVLMKRETTLSGVSFSLLDRRGNLKLQKNVENYVHRGVISYSCSGTKLFYSLY